MAHAPYLYGTLGETLISLSHDLILYSFYSAKAVDLNSPFTYRDFDSLCVKFPVLNILKDQYDLDEKLVLDESYVPAYGVIDVQDSAGIRSIKKWINHPGVKAVTWENLLWLLNECVDDQEVLEKLKTYITSAPESKNESDSQKMDTDQNNSDSEVEKEDTKESG